MGIYISVAEDNLLQKCEWRARLIYEAIRWKMNKFTGISGDKAGRIISTSYLMKRLAALPRGNGQHKTKEKPITRANIRTSIIQLEKIGLIRDMGNLVFECLKASKKLPNFDTRGESDQKRINPSSTRGTTRGTTRKTIPNYLENIENHEKLQPEEQPEEQPEVNPLQDIRNTKDLNIINKEKEKKEKLSVSVKQQIFQAAERVLVHLDAVSGIKRRDGKESKAYGMDINFISAVMRPGKGWQAATEEECIAVIDLKAQNQWFVEKGFLRACTLFNKTKFVNYLREIYAETPTKPTQNGRNAAGNGYKTATQRNTEYWDFLTDGMRDELTPADEKPREIVINPR